jgi:hypothetical protein
VNCTLIRKTKQAISSKIVASVPREGVFAKNVVARNVVSLRDNTTGIARLNRQWGVADWSGNRARSMPRLNNVSGWFSYGVSSVAAA